MRLLHRLLLLMFTVLATASALPQDWSGPKPQPVGVCGMSHLYKVKGKGNLRDDGICNQLISDIKTIKVNKGCVCAAWSTDLCGLADPMDGLKFYEIGRDSDMKRELKEEDHVRWYKCARL